MTLPPTRHTTTNVEVIKSFLDIAIDIEQREERCWEITVGGKQEEAANVLVSGEEKP